MQEIRETLREIVAIQDAQAKVLLRHSELLVQHEERMVVFDERMDRIGRHLELLANISDDLIRNKADRKRR